MLGGKRNLPVFLEDGQFQYGTGTSNSVPISSSVDQVNFFRNEQINSVHCLNKRMRESEDISKQKLLISSNYKLGHNDDHLGSIKNQNPVSTGLRLSYDDEEPNSSVTSANGSMAAIPPLILSLGDGVMAELDQQKEEFNKYMKIQEEHMAKGMREMKQRHITSFLAALQKGVSKKLQEKDLEIENINRKNQELFEKINQVASVAHYWQSKAKYNESVVNVLKSNIQQAISHGAEQGREGFGDSEVDDSASQIDPKNPGLNYKSLKEQMICRVCRRKEVSTMLIPCKHLCLCSDCGGSVGVCPVCYSVKTSGIEVYLS